MSLRSAFQLKRLYPVAAFIGGFLWDALTIGQRVKVLDLWRLSLCLVAAAGLICWLAARHYHAHQAPLLEKGMRGRLRQLQWAAPNLLLQFFFGAIFSALFILYVKSAGHFSAWLVAGCLGALLVANEFLREHYARRFTLNLSLFALSAILLMNFVLPHAVGSLDSRWFTISTLAGICAAHALYRLSPGRPGRIWVAWLVAAVLLLAWHGDMIAPVPLVKRSVAVGQGFSQADGEFKLQVEAAPDWQFWLDQASTAHVAENGRLYGVSSVFAPRGVSAPMEHRWLRKTERGDWVTASLVRFTANGGREGGFRGYSYVTNPQAGQWRLIVATQDGHTISTLAFTVSRGDVESVEERSY